VFHDSVNDALSVLLIAGLNIAVMLHYNGYTCTEGSTSNDVVSQHIQFMQWRYDRTRARRSTYGPANKLRWCNFLVRPKRRQKRRKQLFGRHSVHRSRFSFDAIFSVVTMTAG